MNGGGGDGVCVCVSQEGELAQIQLLGRPLGSGIVVIVSVMLVNK